MAAMDMDGERSERRLEVELDLASTAESFRTARIVVVDDDPSVVQLVVTVLRIAGATDLHGVVDAEQAVTRCRELRPDLLILDLHMSFAVDGLDVLDELNAGDGGLVVMVLSGDTNADAKVRALAAGASDFVVKPFDLVDMVRRVRVLLEAGARHGARH